MALRLFRRKPTDSTDPMQPNPQALPPPSGDEVPPPSVGSTGMTAANRRATARPEELGVPMSAKGTQPAGTRSKRGKAPSRGKGVTSTRTSKKAAAKRSTKSAPRKTAKKTGRKTAKGTKRTSAGRRR